MTSPHPTDYADRSAERSVFSLRTTELFTLSSLRLWALPHRAPWDIHPDWRNGFSAAGLGDEGTGAFDALLQVITTASLRPVDIRCPHCPQASVDEMSLLACLGHLQRGDARDAAACFAGWLPPAANRVALDCAADVARGLTEAGLVLPRRRNAAGREETACFRRADGLHLIH